MGECELFERPVIASLVCHRIESVAQARLSPRQSAGFPGNYRLDGLPSVELVRTNFIPRELSFLSIWPRYGVPFEHRFLDTAPAIRDA